MLNYKTSIKGDIAYSDLEIKEIKPIMKLIIRGKTKEFMTAIEKILICFYRQKLILLLQLKS